ncbi:TPA: phage holin [Streptococcus pneumoniae]
MQIEFFNFLRSVVQTEDGLVLYALALIVSMEIIDFVTGTIAAIINPDIEYKSKIGINGLLLAGVVVRAVKDYLVQKGGEKTIKIVEILAKNAVNAVEQVASETGFKGDEKLEQARAKVRAELTKYNISMTDKDLDTFVESAVKQMNDAWKGR